MNNIRKRKNDYPKEIYEIFLRNGFINPALNEDDVITFTDKGYVLLSVVDKVSDLLHSFKTMDGICINCGLPAIERCTTPLGLKEFAISKLCEVCFDGITEVDEYEESFDPPKKQRVVWLSAHPTNCDSCHSRITNSLIYGRTIYGPWAILCKPCHSVIGKGLGTGRGQLYEYDSDTKQFIKTEG